MKHLSDYVRICPDVLSEEVCEALCLTFETSQGKEEIKNDVIDFTQVNLNVHHSNLLNHLIGPTQEVLARYKKKLKAETLWFPRNTLALEEYRVKCYNGGTGQQFKPHVDVGDHNSSRRFLSFLFYLNDNFTGGETQFIGGRTIKPKRGSVLVFPPTWQYPHAGLPVTHGKKFIMSTYLHYT